MKTNDAVTKMCNVAPYLYDLISDIKGNSELISELKLHQKDKVYVVFKIFPKMLKINPTALYSIIGELFDKSAEEIAEQPIGVTISQIKEIFEDEDLKSFFTSFGETTTKDEGDVER